MLSRLKLLKYLKNLNRCYSSSTKNLLELQNRGFYQDIFPDNVGPQLKKLFLSSPQTIYAGFDPTAKSLHIGNLLVIIGLLHCQRTGHNPIALVGGATGLIGDPSGRTTERSLLGNTIIEENLACIEKQIITIFENHKREIWQKQKQKGALRQLKVVNNAIWYENLNLIDFISKMGRHFRMGSMLSRSSVQTRLASSEGMSFTEFTYQIFQAYDWLHLYKTYNCRFQLGGSDQMGNLMTGHELISRIENKSVFGLTLPIITNEEGDKFGKSGGNPIWLDSEKTSPFSFYQFFIRTPDSEVEKLLKLFTFLPLSDIDGIMEEHRERPEKRMGQKELARELTLLVHGKEGLEKAENVTNALYEGNIDGLSELNINEIKQNFSGATLCEILPEAGMTVLDLAMKSKCFKTEVDACRIISAGGFYINLKKAQNISEIISPGIHTLKNGLTLLRVGKRNYYIVKWLT
ncbi:tyrosine--tRNA ligase, mitochondrial [Condylostylus longicornis]|uniref:tyrosine--tRNA ligase, mitochondrial n=1 Tax=Condylostylus longicornis TaxID=2530218 RepID=UPI00244DB649|nr:tyrosine--tRNA ligase, mitochondrial [Condylostylus longicornis]